MRASRLTLPVSILIVAACSGDTFQAADGGAGAGGTAGGISAGAAGSGDTPAGSAGNGASTAAGSAGSTAGSGSTPAGMGGASGQGGAAGSAITAGAGGAAGKSGAAGGGGKAGAPTCPPPMIPGASVTPGCGNGVVEGEERCDDGATNGGDGCSASCQLECSPPNVLVDEHCYLVTSGTFAASEIYLVPEKPNEPVDFVRPNWVVDPCASTAGGVATHLVLFETLAEQTKLAAAPGFQQLATKIGFQGAWVGVGARYRTGVTTNTPSAWRNGEGGMFLGKWKPTNPTGVGLCAFLNQNGELEDALCPPGTAIKRPVLCERERACAIVDGLGSPHAGYVGPEGHCYARFPTVNSEPVTRKSAEETCGDAGAHLPAFETDEELEALTGANLTSDGVWTAARKLACAGDQFAWETTNQALPPKTDVWDEKEPAPGGDCATMDRNRRLRAAACDGKAHILCERDF